MNLIVVAIVVSLSSVVVVPEKLEDTFGVSVLRVFMVLAILLNMIELFSRVRIFDFFAYFCRQIEEIVLDALPLGAMLGFIVLAQTLIFWILDQNST